MATNISITGQIGMSLEQTSTAALFPLGTRTTGSNGTEWIYVQAAVAIAAYDCVTYTAAWAASGATPTSVATGGAIGFAQVGFAINEYGWITVKGDQLTCNVSATNSPAVQMYVSATTGKLTSTSTSGTLEGVFLVSNVSSTAGVTLGTAFANFPNYKVL